MGRVNDGVDGVPVESPGAVISGAGGAWQSQSLYMQSLLIQARGLETNTGRP